MGKILSTLLLAAIAPALPLAATAQAAAPGPHYLFVWTGDKDKKGNDFLAVIDADARSPSYGRLLTTLATDQQTIQPHHTEYTMPDSAMLFANDHEAGRTFIFDLHEPLHPRTAASFGDMAGYAHPHSYVRLPNGHVLATFQHAHHGHGAGMGKTGGLVEIDDAGHVVRSGSSADAHFADALLMPYGLVVVPQLDRVVSTNSSMHDDDVFSGVTYQVWRLSDLALLKTAYLDAGDNHYGHVSPEEPRLGPDGAVYIQTLGCGIERITGIDGDDPVARLVFTFPGNWCGVPTIVGHYLIQSVPAIHGFIVLDIADGARPREVARLALSDTYYAHWTAWDPGTQRLVATSGQTPADRLYVLKFDQASGALSVDEAFRDADGKVGFSFAARQWPHGWTGVGMPHGAVFSR